MSIILANRQYGFVVFQLDEVLFLTVLAEGSLDHDITITLTEHEVQTFRADRNKAIATASDVTGRSWAYQARRVEPPVRPR